MTKTNLPIVTIVGRPNVGKSSLFNRLLGERKAIVDETPGTTRDRVEAIVEWTGKKFWLVDTAGMETGKDELVQSMQHQLQIAQEQADLILMVVDGSTILSDEDTRVIKQIRKSGKPIVVAANKADRAKQQVEHAKLPGDQVVPVSAIHGTGSGDLLDAITKMLPKRQPDTSKSLTLALLGRPNVGKSSILNAISGEERAIVSENAGTTRDVTAIAITHKKQAWTILDTAGLKRKSKTGGQIEYFSSLRTLGAINDSDVCVLVIDAEEPATAQEQRIAGMVKEAGKGLVLVINKWDTTERTEAVRAKLEYTLKRSFQFVWWAPLLLTSAHTKHNLHKLMPLAETAAKNHRRQVSTKLLNRWLETATGNHPPAGLKNKHPKLNYITQTDVAPPTFTVFGSQTPFLHWSYKRYLETQLREEFDFTGTPIRMRWRSKYKEGDTRVWRK